MKTGDLVKRRGCNWYALVLGVESSDEYEPGDCCATIYWLDEFESGRNDQCHTALLEVVSAS